MSHPERTGRLYVSELRQRSGRGVPGLGGAGAPAPGPGGGIGSLGVFLAALGRGFTAVRAARAADLAAGDHVRALGPMEREPGRDRQVEHIPHHERQEAT